MNYILKKVFQLTLSIYLCTSFLYAEQKIIDLKNIHNDEVFVLKKYSNSPDKHGIMEEYKIGLPEFSHGVYYVSGWWPAGGNRVYPAHFTVLSDLEKNKKLKHDFMLSSEGGIFLILKLKSSRYLALLPIGSRVAYSWLGTKNNNLFLRMGTLGTDPIKGDIPLYAVATGPNLYETIYRVWKKALDCNAIKGNVLMREQKKYPEVFKYLGWCSWEHYKGRINEEKMVSAIRNIEKSGIPIRYFLMDDGHFNRTSLKSDQIKFPNGYKTLTSLKKEDKIKWMGIWYAFLGQNHGVEAKKSTLGDIEKQMIKVNAGALLPKPTEQAAKIFYEYTYEQAKKEGFDFLKIDFATDALPFYAGVKERNPLRGLPADNSHATGNPYAAAVNLYRTMEEIVDRDWNGLINCNWHNTPCIFNNYTSSVGRCSEDYKVGNLKKAMGHLYHSYTSTPWLGQIAWGDHDMFHSNDKFAGRMMAVSKALSGGPIYLSDDPEHFKPDAIYPLCFQDGELLRPLAPATTVSEDVFYSPEQNRLLRVYAPLPGKSVALAIYNLNEESAKKNTALSTTITPEHYSEASGMIQPYPGPWTIPKQGLIIYDVYNKKTVKFKKEYNVSIKGFGDNLYQISPVIKGWSVIGRADKYLPAAAIESWEYDHDKLVIRIIESGPLMVWLSDGTPKSEGLKFQDMGKGLFLAKMKPGERNKTIIIKR